MRTYPLGSIRLCLKKVVALFSIVTEKSIMSRHSQLQYRFVSFLVANPATDTILSESWQNEKILTRKKSGSTSARFSSFAQPSKTLQSHPMSGIYNINDNDVLCGKGKGVQSYPGNVQFRCMVDRKKKDYRTLKRNKDKNTVAMEIMREVQGLNPPGRFLMEDSSGRLFRELSSERVLSKVKQALREKKEDKNVTAIRESAESLNDGDNESGSTQAGKGKRKASHSRVGKPTKDSSNDNSAQRKKREDSLSKDEGVQDFTNNDFHKMIDILSNLSPKSI